MWGAQCLLEVRRRFWGGSGRPSMLMLVRSAAAIEIAISSRWKLQFPPGSRKNLGLILRGQETDRIETISRSAAAAHTESRSVAVAHR